MDTHTGSVVTELTGSRKGGEHGWHDWVAGWLTVTPGEWTFVVYTSEETEGGHMEFPGPDARFPTPQEFVGWAITALSDANLILDGPWHQHGEPVDIDHLGPEFAVGIGLKAAPNSWTKRVQLGVLPADGRKVARTMFASADDAPLVVALASYAPVIVEAVNDPDLLDVPNQGMADLLYAVRKLRQALAAQEEELVAAWKRREGDNLSWTELGAPLGLKRAAAREYYLRIESDLRAGTATSPAAATAPADEQKETIVALRQDHNLC